MESHCKCKLDADLAVAQDAIFSLYWRGRSRRHLSLVPALSNTPLRWHCESVLSYSRASQNHHPPVIPGNGCPVQGVRLMGLNTRIMFCLKLCTSVASTLDTCLKVHGCFQYDIHFVTFLSKNQIIL